MTATATFDRGDKFLSYRLIDSLEEYALVDPHAKTFEVDRRQPNGADWLLSPSRSGQSLELQSVAMTISLDALFENV